jgi:hypothetical protein
MPYLIPNDYDGESYQCIEIQWPDSPQWRAILRGVISEMFRGRIWDETTGSIKATQEIGREIWARSYPFMPCGSTDCPEYESDVTVYVGSMFDDDFSDCEEQTTMSNCPIPPIKIEDGILYWWHCCAWVPVGSIGSTAGQLPDDPLNTEDDPEFQYSACGKATAIVEMIYLIVSACYDQIAEYPWRWIPQIEQTCGYDLDNQWLLLNVTGLIAFDLAGFGTDELFSDLEKQSLICAIAPLMAADGSGISQDTYEEIKEIFAGEFYQDILARGEFYRNAINALGWHDMSAVAQLGVTDTDANCDCPELPFIPVWPDGIEWSYFWDFKTISEMPDEVALLDGSYLTVGEGVRHYSEVSGLGNPTVESIINATDGIVKSVLLRYKIGAPSGEGDYEGAQVLCGTDLTGFINQADSGDTDPSSGGTFTIYKNQNYTIVGGDGSWTTKLEVRDEGSHTEGRTVTIIGLGMAGIGTDPAFSAT